MTADRSCWTSSGCPCTVSWRPAPPNSCWPCPVCSYAFTIESGRTVWANIRYGWFFVVIRVTCACCNGRFDASPPCSRNCTLVCLWWWCGLRMCAYVKVKNTQAHTHTLKHMYSLHIYLAYLAYKMTRPNMCRSVFGPETTTPFEYTFGSRFRFGC